VSGEAEIGNLNERLEELNGEKTRLSCELGQLLEQKSCESSILTLQSPSGSVLMVTESEKTTMLYVN